MKHAVSIVILILLLAGCGATKGTPTPSFISDTVVASVAATPIGVPVNGAPPAGAAATSLPPASPSPALSSNSISNPVLDRDFPDPDAIDAGEVYYAYATNADSMNILVASSRNLSHWNFLGNALPHPPRWASRDFGYNWAPEVSRFSDTYVMYFVSRLSIGAGGVQCIALATSAQPEGPFLPTDKSNVEPFVCQQSEGGSIDPAVFTDDDGKAYFLWKSDANSRGGQTWIYIQPLAPDGMSLEGQPTRLITADTRWEGPLVEAPTLWKHEAKYYLFYSANDYRSRDYAVGYAVADKPTGPYNKGATNPILNTNIGAGVIGPGGQDVVTGRDGKTYMLFHAWRPRGYRALDVAPLEWQDGVPVVKLPERAPAG